jgi:hypothetical protein
MLILNAIQLAQTDYLKQGQQLLGKIYANILLQGDKPEDCQKEKEIAFELLEKSMKCFELHNAVCSGQTLEWEY